MPRRKGGITCVLPLLHFPRALPKEMLHISRQVFMRTMSGAISALGLLPSCQSSRIDPAAASDSAGIIASPSAELV